MNDTVIAWPAVIVVIAVSAWIMLRYSARRTSRPATPSRAPQPTAEETAQRWGLAPQVPPHLNRIAELIDEIEAEVDRIWPGIRRPTDERIAGGGAFGMKTLAFPEWLKHVFVPAARMRLEAGDLPETSSVGTFAVRELDQPEYEKLQSLLSKFDWAISHNEQ